MVRNRTRTAGSPRDLRPNGCGAGGAGFAPADARAGCRAVPRGSRTSTRRNPLGLTRREAEILALLSDGLRNAAIARRLFVSTKTVDHHVSAILTKLGVPSRAEAVAMTRNLPDNGG